MSPTILLFGAGNMGFAMLRGWLTQGSEIDVHVVEPFADFRERAQSAGAHAVSSAAELAETLRPDLVVLAVKPQMVASVLTECSGLAERQAAFLSLAAGVRLATMQAALGQPAPFIRCMPNTPAAIGEGMLVLCAAAEVPQSVRHLAETLMAVSGAVAWIDDEALMDAVTAISGSGPAYVFHFIEALAEAGRRLGLPDETAELLAKQTVAGAGRMAQDTMTTPTLLREQVTSPNGTTQAALSVLMHDGALTELMFRAATAARDRGVELGREG
ncbi:pyrroline-5-carboxylate reductase [Hoeflea alexandrii]|uniref:pyrroline-5-carboxylate reductase n=1 Tax=Hoeflea alexandrii TaxID=288436 RepID=UPI0022AEADD6|nr:pyrroline-5-carboxylate reductase [Hoeflea alexandrii]MCZ4291629.1 pyrroline-5-carboxylate reductase [Hoeflea alexandrii]